VSNRCDGTTNVPTLRESKAYCEGRAAAAAGALVGTNPHPSGSAAATRWAAGFGTWVLDPDGVAQDCCADAYGGGYVPE